MPEKKHCLTSLHYSAFCDSILVWCACIYAEDTKRCREFAQLVEANAVAQLPESAFEVDPGLRDMVEAQIKQEEEAVRQVCLPSDTMVQAK